MIILKALTDNEVLELEELYERAKVNEFLNSESASELFKNEAQKSWTEGKFKTYTSFHIKDNYEIEGKNYKKEELLGIIKARLANFIGQTLDKDLFQSQFGELNTCLFGETERY